MVRGYEVFIRILAMCPCTNEKVAERLGVRIPQAGKFTRDLVKVGLLKVQSGTGNTNDPYIYVRGGERTRMATRPTQMAINLALVMRMLEQPHTCQEICEKTGFDVTWGNAMMRKLRAHNLVHISNWEISGVTRVAVWMLGGGRNVMKPPAKTRKQSNIEYNTGRRWRNLQDQLRALHALPSLPPQGNQQRDQIAENWSHV